MKKIIEAYRQEQEALNKKYAELIKKFFMIELEKLEQDELAPVSSHNCDGDAVATGTYADAFNEIDFNGIIVIYNNNDCEGTPVHEGDSCTIFEQPVDVQIETLQSLIKYNEEKHMTEQDYENLKVVKDSLDPDSELDKSMKKAIKFLKM